ncbi:Skp1 family, dimerization domain-containing protein [Blastocladiella britannica]|nr:Skp1 family, dimerization domain-containing protein [Blastocladiella britannica]
MVKLVSSDNITVDVSAEAAKRSVLLSNLLEDASPEGEEVTIPVPNVTGETLKKVFEYCEHHKNDPMPDPKEDDDDLIHIKRAVERITDWDAEYVKIEKEPLFQVILAANYLDIKQLLDLGCRTVANMIKGKTTQEIRDFLGIVVTPEEEEQIKKENQWAVDIIEKEKAEKEAKKSSS